MGISDWGKARSQKSPYSKNGCERGDFIMKSGRINKRFALLAILCVLAMVFAVPVASAAGYSKVYGQTQDKIRVRESASTNATIIDNIVKDACVYITSSKVSGSNTFVQVKYRASDGSTETGWVCQSDGQEHLCQDSLSGTGQEQVQGERRQCAQQGGRHVYRGGAQGQRGQFG